jgi:xylulokinase
LTVNKCIKRDEKMNYFIGADIGTTGIRAGVYDEEFTLLGKGEGSSNVRRGLKGELIQVPDDFYCETAKAVNQAVDESKIDKNLIACVSFDGQLAGVMGIDKNWNAKTPYDSWLDTRCSEQVKKIRELAGDLVVEKTGNIPSYNHGPKILWWKENEAEIFRDIESFIQPGAYVAGRLCGLQGKDAFVDWTYLHFSGLADNRNLEWDGSLTGLFEIPEEKLPRIVSPLSTIGTSVKKEAELFGDTASCFLGTGAVEKGIAVDVAGTASVFSLTTGEFAPDLSGTVYVSRSVLKDLWYSMSYINGGGLNLEWFKDNFAPDKNFGELDDSIRDIEPGSSGLIFNPHLEGRGYPNVPHMRGQWKGFTRNHTLNHFYRSILEGIGYEYAIYRDRILLGAKTDRPNEVRVVGGGSKSKIWNQIKADILNSRYCTINRSDISILGQAVIAAAACGFVKDIRKTVKKIIRKENVFSPDGKKHKMYSEYITRYKKMLE